MTLSVGVRPEETGFKIRMTPEIRILEMTIAIEILLRSINLEMKELKNQPMNLITIETREEIIKLILNKITTMFLLKIDSRKTEAKGLFKNLSTVNQIITINHPEITTTITTISKRQVGMVMI